ncbi:L-threonylcarbamoyladenylate synthase [Vitreoscilla stercoraria]|uniref:Threonylcarbamoyl-AMP synthase n=1 Tax=Vitreoscilla stercoraria TaxID=61 RepID=A0ABY4E9K9_VITST|nr:L-threonylcarbamoyladenylate synthase [Vitreoscilla stercoraria]AUZ06202.1 threonylcarbamoyl-AMP synthase [Vitreoscilla sp. C1]UOO92437.1 L-threonylcarbamoyladenylate synthase [Vitreoscilla stercoraria]
MSVMYTHRIMGAFDLRRLKQHLRRGGVIAYACEACFGLGCLPNNQRGLRQIMTIKQRPQSKGLIVIGDSLNRLQPLLKPLTPSQTELVNQAWPAAKTFIIPCSDKVSALLRGNGRDKLAVRVPAHNDARLLSKLVASPLVSTSCNRSGKRFCTNTREVKRQFGRQVIVVDGRIGRNKQPSQIFDLLSGRRLR